MKNRYKLKSIFASMIYKENKQNRTKERLIVSLCEVHKNVFFACNNQIKTLTLNTNEMKIIHYFE